MKSLNIVKVDFFLAELSSKLIEALNKQQSFRFAPERTKKLK